MRCSTKYVGFDVHQATTLSVVRDLNGKIIAQSILPTEEAALLELVAGMRGAVHVAVEEGTAGAVAARRALAAGGARGRARLLAYPETSDCRRLGATMQ